MGRVQTLRPEVWNNETAIDAVARETHDAGSVLRGSRLQQRVSFFDYCGRNPVAKRLYRASDSLHANFEYKIKCGS